MNEDVLTDQDLLDEEQQQLYEHIRLEVDAGQEPLRVDKFMMEHLRHTTRNRIQQAASAGFVRCGRAMSSR